MNKQTLEIIKRVYDNTRYEGNFARLTLSQLKALGERILEDRDDREAARKHCLEKEEFFKKKLKTLKNDKDSQKACIYAIETYHHRANCDKSHHRKGVRGEIECEWDGQRAKS
jgi:hypothetical protein